MDYLVSARKWRPQTFKEVIGQQHVARTLTNAIREGRTAHAYLFSGGRGVGKTTMARILAKALNCESGPTSEPCQKCPACQGITAGNSPDVMEIDGASNRGIDEVRELRETIKYMPMQGRYRVYILDEVHMLTKEAFNALLKTLEEPPPHVVFVMATTEIHKIPSTILSRCQHFQFRRMTRQEIMGQLEAIAQKEEIHLSAAGSAALAKVADGSMRDALSLLDQAIAYSGKTVSEEDLAAILGMPSGEILMGMVKALLEHRSADALEFIKSVLDQGYDLRQFSSELVEYFRNLLVAKISDHPAALIDLPLEEVQALSEVANNVGQEELQRFFGILAQALESIRGATHPRFILEMALVKACELPPLQSIAELLEKVERLEKNLPSSPMPAPSTTPPKLEDPPKIPAASPEASPEPIKPSNRWSDVIQAIRDEKPSLASYLEEGRLQTVEEDIVTLGYEEKSGFLADLIQTEENKEMIQNKMRHVFGRSIRLKIERIQGPPKTQEREQEAQRKEKVKREVLSNPIVKEALNLFGGEVVEIRESPGG